MTFMGFSSQSTNINLIGFEYFPSTRYQGSKRKVLPWIYEAVKYLQFNSVLDVFGGSAIVSYLFKRMRKEVTYNDLLKFNYITGKALIENKCTKFTDEEIHNLLQTGEDKKQSTFIEKHFKEIFYLNHENRWLDRVIGNISSMNGYPRAELELKKCVALHALFQASLVKRPFNLFHRANLSLRLREVRRSFGNKVTWDTPFEEHFKRFVKETNNTVFDSGKECLAINKSFTEFTTNGYDLVYLDPPYLSKNGSNETSDYLKCYHFLEGIANYERWEELIDLRSAISGIKNSRDRNLFTREEIYDTFEQLVKTFEKSTIVLSYKGNGIPSIDFLTKLLKKVKKRVTTKSIHYKYALNRQNGDSRLNREVLIIGI